jgi:hypothetical protein
MRIRIQHFRSMLSGYRVMTKKLKHFKAEKLSLLSKIAIYLSLGLHEGRPSCRRSLEPSTSKHEIFFLIFLFLWVVFGLIINADPDFQNRCFLDNLNLKETVS